MTSELDDAALDAISERVTAAIEGGWDVHIDDTVVLVEEVRRLRPHTYTVDVVLHGVEPYPCVICGGWRQDVRHVGSDIKRAIETLIEERTAARAEVARLGETLEGAARLGWMEHLLSFAIAGPSNEASRAIRDKAVADAETWRSNARRALAESREETQEDG